MDLEIFIHGVPDGQKIYGKKDDLPYLQSFYGRSNNEETKFLIEFRNLNDRNYCYYSYLKSQNIIAFNGRSGSYFGISIRIDAYCTDFINMYRLMDIVYNKFVLGYVLSLNGENPKYLTPDFRDDVCSRIRQTIETLIRNLFNDNDFRSNLQKIQIVNSNRIEQLNILDCTKENVWNLLVKDSKIVISPEFQTRKEYNLSLRYSSKKENIIASKNTEIQNVRQEYDKRVNELQKLFEEERNAKNISSRNLREQFDRDRSNYESEINRLKIENQKLKSLINSIVNTVREFLPAPQVTPSPVHYIKETKDSLEPPQKEEMKKPKASLPQQENKPIEEIYLQKHKSEKQKKSWFSYVFSGTHKQPVILIRKEKDGAINVGNKYIIEIQNLKDTEGGKWKVTNAEILNQNEKHCKIRANQAGSISIQYIINNSIVTEKKTDAYIK